MNTPTHGYWIHTHSGMAFDLLSPTPGMVVLEDIAYALSRLCRFTGHCSRHYSVAEHSINVAKQCQLEHGFSDQWAIAALLHDAAEAYIGDLSSPLKGLLRVAGKGLLRVAGPPSDLDVIESNIKQAIADHFNTDIMRRSTYSSGLLMDPLGMAERKQLIKAVDLRMLATERRDLMPSEPSWAASGWASTGYAPPEPYEWAIDVGQPKDAARMRDNFLAMFSHLGGRR